MSVSPYVYECSNLLLSVVQDYLYLHRPILFAVATACQLICSSSTEPCSKKDACIAADSAMMMIQFTVDVDIIGLDLYSLTAA